MQNDRYGLTLSTQSAEAAAAYRDGAERLLTLYPGAPDAFDRAIAADPGFALAHAGKARAEAMRFDMPAARAAIAVAQSLASGATEREASHIGLFALMLSGQSAAALDAVYAHLKAWPLDALVPRHSDYDSFKMSG